MSEHLSHPRRRQVLDRPSVIERIIRVNLYFIQEQLGAAAMAAIGAVGFHRPAQPAGSSDQGDGEIKLEISRSRESVVFRQNLSSIRKCAAELFRRFRSLRLNLTELCKRKRNEGVYVRLEEARGDRQAVNEQDNIAQRPTSKEEEHATNEMDDTVLRPTSNLSDWSLWYLRWKILFVILCTLNLLGLAALGIYDYQTYYCAESVHFPHYHCENGTSIIPYQTAMNVELAFVCSQLLSRLIFVALISLRRLKREELKDIFWKVVWNHRVYTWPPLLFYGLSFWRFVLFLLDEDHLGTYKAIARATISLYIFDDLGALIVVYVLNYVKIQDLSKDKWVRFGFRFVLFCFWLQFFSYTVISTCQLFYGVWDQIMVMSLKAMRLLTNLGQGYYLKILTGYLWVQFNYGDNPTVGVRLSAEN